MPINAQRDPYLDITPDQVNARKQAIGQFERCIKSGYLGTLRNEDIYGGVDFKERICKIGLMDFIHNAGGIQNIDKSQEILDGLIVTANILTEIQNRVLVCRTQISEGSAGSNLFRITVAGSKHLDADNILFLSLREAIENYGCPPAFQTSWAEVDNFEYLLKAYGRPQNFGQQQERGTNNLARDLIGKKHKPGAKTSVPPSPPIS